MKFNMMKAIRRNAIWIIILLLKTGSMYAQDTENLNEKQRAMVEVSALTALGNVAALELSINRALDSGTTLNELKEVFVQLYAYCGFPRSFNALNTLQEIVKEREKDGRKVAVGQEIAVDNIVEDKYEQGRKVLETLTQRKQPKPAPGFGEFAPRIDRFLKEHLFGDIFSSDVLSYQSRELVTISALASMQGLEGQLKSHIDMGINTGISHQQLSAVFEVVAQFAGAERAATAAKLVAEIKE